MPYLRVTLIAWAVLCFGCSGTVGGASPDQLPTGGPPGETFPAEAPVSPIVRRLTADEYARTVRDVIGVTLPPNNLAQLPVGRPIEGFVNVASGQTVSTDHVRAYANLARLVVADAGFGSFVDAHSACEDPTRTCGETFIESAGKVILRRPVSDEDTARFAALFDAVVAEDATFREAVGFVTEAMLQSPGFLYLLQIENQGGGTTRDLDGYEMASRLSYFLWGSAPDEALYEAAASGDLGGAEGLEAEAMRMLSDRERVQEGLARFVVDWARLQSLPDDDGLKSDRIEAAVAYYANRVESGSDLFALYGDGQVFLTGALADSYGVPSEGAEMQSYQLPTGMGPGGLLGQPGIIAGMTNADGGEIVARGLFLMAQLFCETPPQFAASLQDAIDAFVAEQPADASDRDIAEARLLRPECAACHASFDPLAYGFEQFDFQGSFRTGDELGNTLQTDGWIPGRVSDDGTDVPYADVEAYMALLGQSLSVRRCMTRHQAEFALGLRMQSGQERAVAEIGTAVELSGGDHESLVAAIVTNDVFRKAAIVP